ncbi:MAG: type IV pilin protein [Gallionella sp.]|nr:type IV pilin protein [Gallionella sp.]
MKTHKGFSLIELMVAVAIIGILAAVAIPSYQSHVVKGNRAAAQAFMVDVANREKQYLLDARSYAADLATLGMTPPTDVSKHYPSANIIIAVVATPPSFTITATPTSAQQAGDGALTLTSDGIKGPAGKW